ncbi:carbohydrate ABC transporter permease [Actinobacteria bacterium YIM 96077]|uniref:Carbohydrate ABC transporter permease n=1 Tax=Phytoactinopolyspora halophila TaxID=1981511 RepID=A0A329QA73_9ACTN|nr:carbohydrate ABC transporter permease [Phytoactinopolyspora halophila]AYY12908.1 carbohydrate ABC transporter permease [Actinobacteria bacterium YIM 96077]RAW09295.1 carbohydrate ABC transporter permease [Phytoactinopolyspora halophila]
MTAPTTTPPSTSPTTPRKTGARRVPRATSGTGEPVLRAGPLAIGGLIVAAILSIFPLYWMVVVASRTSDAAYSWPPHFLPGGNLGENIQRVLENPDAAILRGLMNSFIASGTITITTVFFGALAGFAFAKLRFRGKNALLLSIVLTMMVPIQLGIVPLYIMMDEFGWLNDIKAVTVPFLISGFGIFLMRQYSIQAIPDELIEAARVDGCSTWRIFWNVAAPALRPAAGVLGLLTFMQYWNDFFWPFIVLADPGNPTVQISLRTLNSAYHQDLSQIFAGTVIATLPLVIIFMFFFRQIISGIMEGATKG